MNFEQFANGDGTYDGVAMMSALTGLHPDEILWTFNRVRELMKKHNLPREEALKIVKEEQKEKPWLST